MLHISPALLYQQVLILIRLVQNLSLRLLWEPWPAWRNTSVSSLKTAKWKWTNVSFPWVKAKIATTHSLQGKVLNTKLRIGGHSTHKALDGDTDIIWKTKSKVGQLCFYRKMTRNKKNVSFVSEVCRHYQKCRYGLLSRRQKKIAWRKRNQKVPIMRREKAQLLTTFYSY